MQRQNFPGLIRFSCVLSLSLLAVMIGGSPGPQAVVQTGSLSEKNGVRTIGNTVSAKPSTAVQFSQQGAKLVGTGALGNPQQGNYVSVSADRNTAIVGGFEGGLWVLKSPANSPPPRQLPGMAYDAARSQVVMFGGADSLNDFNDTWVWDGATWTQKNPLNSPTRRTVPVMAYDAARGEVVLFGGFDVDANQLTDTWVWDGTNWTQKSPANSPPPRQLPGMAYDAARGQMVLFGGFNGFGNNLNDTWVWDGTNWMQKSPVNSPAPRDFHSMAYDAARGQVVLFGGLATNNGTNTNLNDTWVWDGANWTQKSPLNSPTPARYTQAMAYDSARREMVLFGGSDGLIYLNDTWVSDGANWIQESPANSPTRRLYHAMTYDTARGQMVLFGGYDGGYVNDTWVFTSSQCDTVSFAAPSNFAVGTTPLSAAVGDFNADGKLDLAVTNQISSNVSVLLGTGGGTFGAATNFTVGIHPVAVAVGDFNGDSKLDIVTANSDSSFNYSVSVLLGNGAGSFSPPINKSFGVPPLSVAVGDFNNDGKLDLAVGDGGGVLVLLGDGAGGFPTVNAFAAGVTPGSVAVGDFNNDGKLDLAVANLNSSNVSVLLGNGAGGFAPATNFLVGSTPYAIGVGDFNTDGRLDLAIVNRDSNNVSVLLGNAGGGFTSATNFAVGAQPSSVAVADLNADGKLDLTIANHDSSNVSVLLGNGTGGFVSATNFIVGSGPSSVVAGDFDGEANLDLAIANSNSDTVSILINNCGTTSANCVPTASGLVSWWSGDGNANDINGGDNGTALNGLTFTTGKVGQAFNFNGFADSVTGGYVSITDSAELRPSQMTFEGWFLLRQQPPGAPLPLNGIDHFMLASKYDGSYHGWILRVANDLRPTLSLARDSVANVHVGSSIPIQLNTWVHLAGTYDGTIAKIYVNGSLTGSVQFAGGYAPTTVPMTIGAASWYSGGYTDGLGDEVSIYNRALSALEIQAIFNANSGGKCKPTCYFTSCTATGPSTGSVGTASQFSASATASCGDSLSYDWNFGDRSPHSNQPGPTHTYSSAGIYSWTLTTNVSGASACVRTGRITIDAPGQYCLTTSVSPPDAGTVTSGGCYSRGAFVFLQATPASGYKFGYWSGDLTGATTPPTENVQMTRNKNLVANFVPVTTTFSGTIRIADDKNFWPLNGEGVVCLRVSAKPHGGGIVNEVDAAVDRNTATYTFTNLITGSYDLSVAITYMDNISEDTSSLVSGCYDQILLKTAVYKKMINTANLADPDVYIPSPLVMVHGIFSCYQKWYSLDSIVCSDRLAFFGDDWDNFARGQGYITFTPNYYWLEDSTHPWEVLAGQILAQVTTNLRALSRQSNGGKYPPWVYIGHSQGGLVARVLTSGNNARSSAIRSISKIYLLGTPNSGTFDTPLGLLEDFLARIPAVPGYLLSQPMRRDFNVTYDSFGTKDNVVTVFAGNALLGSDVIVPVDSVHNIFQRFCSFGFCLNRTNRFYTGLDFPYYHWDLGSAESRNLLSLFILPDIAQAPTKPIGMGGPTTVNGAQIDMRAISSQVRFVEPGSSDSIGFIVGTTDRIEVSTSIIAGAAAFALVNPSGQIVDFSALSPLVGRHVSSSTGDVFVFHNPAAGTWALTAAAGPSATTYKVDIGESSPLGFEAFVAVPTLLLGQSAHLIAQWSGDPSGVTSSVITAQLVDKLGAAVGSLALYDDGAHGDGNAGDGVFGGDTLPLATTGRYTATFTAHAVSYGQPFARTAAANVDIISSSHLFTGDFSDGVYDSDEDGNFDILNETVVITLAAAGNFLVSADIEDAQGYFVDHAVGNLAASTAGTYSVGMSFDMRGVTCAQFSSPFSIKNLTLTDGSSLNTLDIWTDNIVTQTYDGSLLGCVAGTPLPTITNVHPGAMFPGDSKQVFISGKSFQNGAQLSFGPGVVVSSTTIGSSSTLLAQVSVSAGATAGPRDITVTNPDGRSFTGSALFNVASDQPPAVSINNVADQQSINGTVTISATATDDLGVQKVEFYVDGLLSGTDTSFPYQLIWNTSTFPNGPHTLAAKAYDTANQTSQHQINVIVSCISSYAPISQSFPADGGPGTITVLSTATCSWTASSNASWLMITSGGGSGSGSVGFSVDPNTGPARVGTLTIAGQTFTVNQDSGCSFALGAPSQEFGSEGGTGSVTITCVTGCLWTATSNDSWITINSTPNGSGNGSVDYSVAANPSGDSRTGTITIAGQTFTVNQSNNPTAVNLESFIATAYDSGVFVEWRTGLEVENLGFHVYRDQNGQRVRITPEIVAGSALIAGNKTTMTAGNGYAWWDALSKEKQDAQYWLEDIDIDGKSTLHGPITPKRTTGLPAEQSTASLLSRIGKGEPRVSQLATNQNASSTPSQKQFEAQKDLAGNPALKLTIKEEGWYRVTQPELLAAGLDPKTDPRNLQLYLEGEEQPMLVLGEQDRSLDQADSIEFYAFGQDIPTTDAHTYWLVSGKQPGKRIVVTKSDAKSGGATSFSYTVERKEKTIYFSSLKNGDEDNFFGQVVTSQPVDQGLKLQHLAQISELDGLLEVALQGVTDLPGLGPDHQVNVTLNGTLIGRMIFDGRQHRVERFSVPGRLMKEGDNVVTLVAEAGPSDISLVDFIRITYRHAYTADRDSLRMTVEGAAQHSQTIDGFTNASIRVVDITNPNEPQELMGAIEERKTGGFAVTVNVPDGFPRTLLSFTADQTRRLDSITVNQASNLRDRTRSADLLIITHRTFAESLAPLAALRRKQGLSVETIDVEDVYDEFSFGEKSPQAIRDFLTYARANWKLAPRFVLFAGDASFDPRNYLGAGDFDLVPTKLIDTTYLETASDDWFVDFNDDGLAEMFVGRLPVRTPAEAAALVAKIVNYDSSIGKAPTQQRSVLLVADKNDGFNFEQASEQLRSLIPAGTNVQEIFRSRLDDESAKKQLIVSINAGQSIVNYTGHGSTNVWRNLFTTTDISSLENRQRLPLFVTMTCLNGFIQDPVTESLAKGLIKAERGGAIAVWSSSGLTLPAQQALINQQLYRLIFDTSSPRASPLTLGEMTSKAKSATNDLDVRRTWLLLGDPTTRLK